MRQRHRLRVCAAGEGNTSQFRRESRRGEEGIRVILAGDFAVLRNPLGDTLPEGNTLHRLAREHNRDLSGRRVRVASPHGHFASEARRLDGRVFQRAEARGKHLFHHWQGNLIVHVHLGMFGWFYRRPGPPSEPRPTVRMRLTTREVTHDLIGPPTLELVTAEKRRQILQRLGPDPLDPRADPERFREALVSTDVPVAHALLDQRIVSGVGNIYRAEALYLTGIHPLRKASSLTKTERELLWQTLRALMRRGARQGRTATVAPEDLEPKERRSSEEAFYVYQRERCRRCGRKLRRFPLSGRTMYACAGCQPRRRPIQTALELPADRASRKLQAV